MRAIILGSEIIGFLVFGVISLIIFWRRDCLEEEKNVAKIKRNINIINFIINFIIILSIVFFSFKSFIFLSVNKIIFVTFTILLSSIVIILKLIGRPKTNFHQVICFMVAITIFGVFSLEFVCSDKYIFEGKTIVFEDEVIEIIEPVEISNGKKIGFIKDSSTDEIERYMFYYWDEDTYLVSYKELDMTISDGYDINNGVTEYISVRVININQGESYVEKETKFLTYRKNEKRPEAEDYMESEIRITYVIYLNPDEIFPSSPKEIQAIRVE